MRDITCFSANVVASFDGNEANIAEFVELAKDSANKVYVKYNAAETDTILRKQFDQILGINFKQASAMKRRQAWRAHGPEVYSVIEDVILDKMTSGWTPSNAAFMAYVDDKNIANGDKNEFFVRDTALLTVSKFAGNHHDVIRQKVQPGKAFTVDTSWYVIRTYADYEAFQTGRIDFAEMVERMNKSIEQYRYAALSTAFMGLDAGVDASLKYEGAFSSATVPTIVDTIEAVKAATGKDVVLVGTRTAISRLQGTVSYDVFSETMKNEKYQKGILGRWEGYECIALDAVNVPGTLTSVFSANDNKKILVLPVDPEFKPIKRVIEGDVMYTESGMDGNGNMDMTMTADIRYQEGIGVVADQYYGEIVYSAG